MLKQAVAIFSVTTAMQADSHTMDKKLLPDPRWLKNNQHFHKKQSNNPLPKANCSYNPASSPTTTTLFIGPTSPLSCPSSPINYYGLCHPPIIISFLHLHHSLLLPAMALSLTLLKPCSTSANSELTLLGRKNLVQLPGEHREEMASN